MVSTPKTVTQLESFRHPLTLLLILILLGLEGAQRLRPGPARPPHAYQPPSFARHSYAIWFTLLLLVGGWIPANRWSPALYSGAWLLTLSLLFLLWARLSLGPNFTPCDRAQLPERLVLHGPYRWIRHPIYAAYLLHWLSLCLIFPSPPVLGLSLVMLLTYPSIARMEEASLAQHFAEYPCYRERTWAFLPPPVLALVAVGLLGLARAYWVRPPSYQVSLLQLRPYAYTGESAPKSTATHDSDSLCLNPGHFLEYSIEPHQGARLSWEPTSQGSLSVLYGGCPERADQAWERPDAAKATPLSLRRCPQRSCLRLTNSGRSELRLKNPRLEFWTPPPRPTETPPRSGPRPSVILILADEASSYLLPEDHCTQLLKAYPQSDSWPVSLASALTSQPPRVHAVTCDTDSLPKGLWSLPQALRQAGYQTVGIHIPASLMQGFDRNQIDFSKSHQPVFVCLVKPTSQQLQQVLQEFRQRQQYDGALIILASAQIPPAGLTPWRIKFPQMRYRRFQLTEPWQHLDLAPLILQEIGLPIPDSLVGRPPGEGLEERPLVPIVTRVGQTDRAQLPDWLMIYDPTRSPSLRLHPGRGNSWDLSVDQISRQPALRAYLWSRLQGQPR